MSLAILFHFLCAQHVSDLNISIIRSLRLCFWITTSVVVFSVRCVLEIWCGWVWVVSVLQAEACASACNTDTTQTQPHQISNTQRTENTTTDVVIQQQSRKFLMMDMLMSETCRAHKKWNKIASDIKLVFYSSTSWQHCEAVQANYVGLSDLLGFVYKNGNVKWIYSPWKLFSFRSVYLHVKNWEFSAPIILK